MAKEIRINNSCILKRRLDITDIIGNENYGISYLDENFRRTDDEGEACFTVLYDKTCIGRGVQVNGIGNKNSIHLAVSLPCTEEDIRLLYNVAGKIASLWKTRSISVDDNDVDVRRLGECIKHDIAMNMELLNDAPEMFDGGFARLYCATLPVCVPAEQLQRYSKDYEEFGKYLHSRQETDVFYSSALFFQQGDIFCSLYVVIPDGGFVLPDCPEMAFSEDGAEKQCSQALVAFPGLFPDENVSTMDFHEFMDRIPEGKVTRFDCCHKLVSPISVEEFRNIFR